MTKKDFFGKLLSNRRDEPSPWDSNESTDAQPDVDVEEAPSSENDAAWEDSAPLASDEPPADVQTGYDDSDEFEVHSEAPAGHQEEIAAYHEEEYQEEIATFEQDGDAYTVNGDAYTADGDVYTADGQAYPEDGDSYQEDEVDLYQAIDSFQENFGDVDDWVEEVTPLDNADDPDSLAAQVVGDGLDSPLPEVSPSLQEEEAFHGESSDDDLEYATSVTDAGAASDSNNHESSPVEEHLDDPVDRIAEETFQGAIPLGSTGVHEMHNDGPIPETNEGSQVQMNGEVAIDTPPLHEHSSTSESQNVEATIQLHADGESVGAGMHREDQAGKVLTENANGSNVTTNGIPANGTAANGAAANGSPSTDTSAHASSANGNSANGNSANGSSAHGSSANGTSATGTSANGKQTSARTAVHPAAGKQSRAVEDHPTRTGSGSGAKSAPTRRHPDADRDAASSGGNGAAPGRRPPRDPAQTGDGASSARTPERPGGTNGTAGSKPAAPVKRDVELRGLKDRVVMRMLQKQIVTPEQVKRALRDRTRENLKATLWRIVAQQNGVDRERVYREAALTYAFVERKLDEKDVDLQFIRQVADVFPEKRRNRLIELRVVPVGYEYEQQTQQLRVVFLTHDPSLPAVRALMQELNLERYELQYASETAVKDLLAKAFPRKNEYLERMTEDPLAYDLGMSYEDDRGELIDEEALEAEINRSSLINLFEAALVEAVHKGASDIHIYPNAKRQIEIHFRVDGRLVLWHVEDKVHPEALLAVIKDNTTNVDRFEREMAQDGFIQRKVEDTLIRYRVSILPIATAHQAIHAESIVIRVLDDRKVITDLSRLGLLKGALERFDTAIRQPHGMVILTGPTGSGKSTTLVAALHQVVNQEINTLTVEDPVEYIIPGVRQIKLNHKLSLEQALRAILRHDPDVVMVGEMRDRPTAELAIKLANTGHLTFSTLHTNDAPSAVSRLYKMGVEPFLIAYAINLVVAQRLIRSLCPTCKTEDKDPDPVVLDRLGFTKSDIADTTFYKASIDSNCKSCKGSGYRGRRAISEALYFTRTIRHLIVEADTKIEEDALRDAARKEGMLTLQDSAREVVKMGDTSIDEMMRVTAAEE